MELADTATLQHIPHATNGVQQLGVERPIEFDA